MRAGVAAAPARADLKVHLVRALFRTGAMAEIVERMRPAVADDNADPELLYWLGRAALATGEHRLAADALRSAGAKGNARAFGYLAEALARLDRADEALDAARLGLEHSPSGFASLRVVADVLRNRGQIERLWALCVEHRARGAWGGWFSAVMASTAALLGHKKELDELIDLARWCDITGPAMPEDFNRSLAAELLALHSAKAPADAGRRVDQLELVGGPLAQELLARVREAVEAYVTEREGLSHHPMMGRRPRSVALHAWSLAAHGSEYHGWHIHRAGWISGVYYVAVPKMRSTEAAHPGGIEFGLFPFGPDEKIFLPHRSQLEPEAGQLLLFPSYYAHRTWPTGIGDPRISVAFDIRPSEAAPDG
jgi:tetratricopeptide (TPR) repeat protein